MPNVLSLTLTRTSSARPSPGIATAHISRRRYCTVHASRQQHESMFVWMHTTCSAAGRIRQHAHPALSLSVRMHAHTYAHTKVWANGKCFRSMHPHARMFKLKLGGMNLERSTHDPLACACTCLRGVACEGTPDPGAKPVPRNPADTLQARGKVSRASPALKLRLVTISLLIFHSHLPTLATSSDA